MAEYISRETMIKLLQRMADNAEANGFYYDREVIESVMATLAGIPASDVAPVVRCKDCKHFNRREHRCESNDVHCDLEGGAEYSIGFDVDDFCCFGEKKE